MTAKKNDRLRTIDELEQNILGLAWQINMATYEMLMMIREFDERAGYLVWSLQSTAEWLAWRIDISMSAAREKVRVAHALKVLPPIARAFANRSLRISRNANRGMVSISIDLPVEMGELVDKALDKARDDSTDDVPDIVEMPWQAKQADAFVALIKAYLLGESSAQVTSGRDNYLVTIHVDQSALTDGKGRSSIPIETAKRLCCDGHAVTLLEDDNGEPLAVSRKKRAITLAVERAVRARDNNTCRFPGCQHSKFTDCHHIDHWANGGESVPDNLMLLCSRHHTLVHEGKFRILKDFRDRWFFARPDGVAIPDQGYVEKGLPQEFSIAYKNPFAEGSGLRQEMTANQANEPPAPAYWH